MVYATFHEHNSFYTLQEPRATFSTQQEPIKNAEGEKNNIVNKGLVLVHKTLKQRTARKKNK